ncbi:MAG: outer membrane beta-barrel protein, partial [Segetibacter sp.]|nr:outer membrane beta-barrel protein [Segetibacter sp.]
MKNSLLLITLFALTTLSSFVYAQNKIGKVTGVAKSFDGKVLDGATIGLLRAKDKSLARSAISNKAGEFEIEKIADGQYIISVTAVGYAKYLGKSFDISETNSNVDLKVLELQAANKTVGTVTVTTTRPLIENKIDKMIVNVEAAVTNIGANAMDVIEKSPGISVDRDGNISLKGKQGVIILIDGKPSYLSGQDLANLLRNMPADQLDQLEIMSQPSARFDASGNSGVLNIKTKRNNLKGFNGSASATYTQGVYPKTNTSFNINSRKGKINVFANYSYSYFKGFEDNNLYRKFHNQRTKELTSIFDQSSYIIPTGQPQNLKAGIDLFASEKTTLGIVVGGNYNLRKTDINGYTNIIGANGRLDSINKAENSNRDPWYNYSANFNLKHVIDKKGKEITSDVDYVKYVSRNKQNSDNYTFSPAGSQLGTPYLLRGYLPSYIDIYSARVDYVHPLKKNAKFEAGVKSSYVTTDNDAQFTYWDGANSKWTKDAKSNHFIYKENINAAYVNTSKQMKKWGVQLGLRLENTNAKGNQ